MQMPGMAIETNVKKGSNVETWRSKHPMYDFRCTKHVVLATLPLSNLSILFPVPWSTLTVSFALHQGKGKEGDQQKRRRGAQGYHEPVGRAQAFRRI